MRNIIAAVTAVILVAACDSSTGPAQNPTLWEAELSGAAGHEEVTGAGAVAATLTAFEAEIELSGLAEGDYEWELAAGTCEEPGARIGAATAYETLTAAANGEASGSAEVSAVLTPSGAYHLAVFAVEEVDGEDERVDVACGDLERQE